MCSFVFCLLSFGKCSIISCFSLFLHLFVFAPMLGDFSDTIRTSSDVCRIVPMLLALLCLYIFLLIVLSVYRSKQTKEQNARNFLTASGSASAILCALSLVSTIIGGSATLGIGALAQKIGTAAFWWLGGRCNWALFARFVDRPCDSFNRSLYFTRCIGASCGQRCQALECFYYRGELG